MKNFFEAVKEFCAQHLKQVTFVIFAFVGTLLALLSNYASTHGYGDILHSGDEHHRTYYHDDRRDRYERRDSTRKPWTMQKPSSKPSSNSHSSSHK